MVVCRREPGLGFTEAEVLVVVKRRKEGQRERSVNRRVKLEVVKLYQSYPLKPGNRRTFVVSHLGADQRRSVQN